MKTITRLLRATLATAAVALFFQTANSQCTNHYYIRNYEPWGASDNLTAMDAVYGAGNYTVYDFATATNNISAIFSSSTCSVFLEGSQDCSTPLSDFINANSSAMEDWVSSGGRLLIKAANQSCGFNDSIIAGFGGVSVYVGSSYLYELYEVSALISDPIFTGPFSPVGTTFSGSGFSHDNISGPGLTNLIGGTSGTGFPNVVCLAKKIWGNGLVYFCGMTVPSFQGPFPNVQNLLNNIIYWVQNESVFNISTGPVASSFCAGETFNVDYNTSNGTFNAGNILTVQRSSASGSFAHPKTMGTLQTTDASGTISAKFKSNTVAGTHYRIRVVSSDPPTTGNDNGADITVGVIASAGSNTPVCAGSDLNLKSSGGTAYLWSGPNGFTSTDQNPTVTTAGVNASGDYSVVVTVCNGSTATASTTVTVNPNDAPVAGSNSPVCAGNSVFLTSSPANSYSWTGPNNFTSNLQNPAVTGALAANGGDYTVTVTHTNGCSSSASTNVSVNNNPTASASNNTSASGICAGNSVQLNYKGIQTFGISAGDLIDLPYSCNSGISYYNGYGSSSIGFSWIDSDTGHTISSVTIQFSLGDNCNQGIHNTSLNGFPAPDFTSNFFWCNCYSAPSTPQIFTINVDPASYYQGGQNIFQISKEYYSEFGLFPDATLKNFFALVTVTYADIIPGQTFKWRGPNGFTSKKRNPVINNAGSHYSGTYTVTVTNSDGCTSTATTDVIVNPKNTVTVSSNSPVCQGSDIVLGASAGASYSWSGPNGFTSTERNPTIPFAFDVNAGDYTVSENGCNNGVSVNVAVIAPPDTFSNINGPTAICSLPATVSYSVALVNGATSYMWSVPANASITSGQGTNSISVSYDGSFTSGNLTITAGNSCGNSVASKEIVYGKPAKPGMINGSTFACGGSPIFYYVDPVPGTDTYNWTVPNNATIQSGQGTNGIWIYFNTSFNSGKVKVTASNNCGVSAVRSFTVSGKPPAPAAIFGQTSGVCNSDQLYFIDYISQANFYTWTIPTGASILGGDGTNYLTVSFSASFVSGTLSVKANDACGASAATSILLTGAPAAPFVIYGNAGTCEGNNEFYSIDPLYSAISYAWTVPAGSSITDGQGTTGITVLIGSLSGSDNKITVQGVNDCGNGDIDSLTLTSSCRLIKDGTDNSYGITIYPNPTSGKININAEEYEGKVQLQIVNSLGQQVINNEIILSGEKIISMDVSALASGIYKVVLLSGSGMSTGTMVKE
jgi:hypothetical protein